ncbi:MAG: PP2C family protein-serine/threonine phosphatase, partial [Proteobacteria bacterium]|nr:PP2C family protein-serine/threonine phosphatase [Pseudomonadota bacterium]
QQSKPGSLISFESECSIADQRRFFHWELTPLSLAKSDQRHVHILIGSDTTEARTSFENWLSLQRDIAVGSTVQSMLLPKGQLFDLPGVQVAAFYEASAQVSGDFWWYRIFPGVGALVLVCDVMGHGVGSAIASGVAVGAIESIMGDLRLPTVEQISSRLLNIDSVLSARFERNFMFCVSAVWIPDQANKLVIWSCGLPLPIIMDDKKAPTPFTASRSSPFGIGENTELTPAIIKTAPGLSLFLFSDGCYEFTYEGKLFGRQKFKRLLEDSINLSTAEQIAKFGESHKTLRQTKHPSDDVTLIAIRCT